MKNIQLLDTLIGRFPLGNSAEIYNINEKEIIKKIGNKKFMEALFIGSPNLHSKAIRLLKNQVSDKEKEGIVFGVLKYLIRYSFRPTPFGLFSACSLLNLKDSIHKNDLQIQADIKRKTKFDLVFVGEMIQWLEKDPIIKMNIKYRINSSLYKVNNDYRYIEYRIINGKRTHQVTQLVGDSYLTEIIDTINNQELSFLDLVNKLSYKNKFPQEELHQYINSIIESQVIVSELELSSIDPNNFNTLINRLTRITDKRIYPIRQFLTSLKQKLKEIDNNKENDCSKYLEIYKSIKQQGLNPKIDKLFQTDTFIASENSCYRFNKGKIMDLLSYLSQTIYTPVESENTLLNDFKISFTKRYQEAFISLSTVLDPDIGIGFPVNKPRRSISPLINSLPIKSANFRENNKILFSTKELKILKWLTSNSKKVINIEDIFPKTNNANKLDYPESMSLLFRTGKINGQDKILFEFAGGTSAINLLGRFSHTDKNLLQFINNISNYEKELNPDILYTEIAHIPEARVGNILCRNSVYDAQIPYLSNYTSKNTIPISDLLVTVRQNRIILWSKSKNKEIVPRLSNAHNFANNSNPIYHFLCSIQTQGTINGLSFQWGNVNKVYKKLPRVEYKNIILSLAQWNIDKNDIEQLKHCISVEGKIIEKKLTEWRNSLSIPEVIILSEGDNELLVNFKNPLITLMFISEIRKKDRALIKEYPFDLNESIVNINGNSTTNQFIGTLINQKSRKIYRGTYKKVQIDRKFVSGKSWDYFKIYGGAKKIESVLCNDLFDLLINSESLWFFIRYGDPDNHIRLRFHRNKKLKERLLSYFDKLVKDNFIERVTEDVYDREINRYGEDSIELAEEFFNIDSIRISSFLRQNKGLEEEEERWMFCLKNIDFYLSLITTDFREKHNIIKPLRNSYSKEFRTNKSSDKLISNQFRKHRSRIENALPYFNESNTFLNDFSELLNNNTESRLSQILNISYQKNILASFFHMSINRTFCDKQRLHEFIIYDYLQQFYKSAYKRMEVKKQ